jgi:DNA-binding LacI/PurR family transcriptional regulator
VVGFDDIDLAAIVRPALTTNRVERELLGVYGVRRLIERAHDNETPPMAITFSTRLIERDSVRRIGAG